MQTNEANLVAPRNMRVANEESIAADSTSADIDLQVNEAYAEFTTHTDIYSSVRDDRRAVFFKHADVSMQNNEAYQAFSSSPTTTRADDEVAADINMQTNQAYHSTTLLHN